METQFQQDAPPSSIEFIHQIWEYLYMRLGEDLKLYPDFPSLSSAQQQEVIRLLAEEFFPHRIEQGRDLFYKSLRSDKEQAVTLAKNDKPIGVITYKHYPFFGIAKQLYIDAKYDGQKLASIRLRCFKALLQERDFRTEDYSSAVELAYIVILKQFRKQGLTYKMAYLVCPVVQQLLKRYPNSVFFTFALGDYAKSGNTKELMDTLLEAERTVNGSLDDGRARVTGTWVDVQKASLITGRNLEVLTENAGSEVPIRACKKVGAKFICFDKKLSPTWAIDCLTLADFVKRHPVSSTRLPEGKTFQRHAEADSSKQLWGDTSISSLQVVPAGM